MQTHINIVLNDKFVFLIDIILYKSNQGINLSFMKQVLTVIIQMIFKNYHI